MNTADRKVRDQKIVRLFRDGARQVEIARIVGVNAPHVSRILKLAGALPPVVPAPDRAMTIWEREEDPTRIRKAIWRRQREGARAALAAMRVEQ